MDPEQTPNPAPKNTVRKFITLKRKQLTVVGVIVLVVAAYLAGVSSSAQVNLKGLGINVLNQKPNDSSVTNVDYGLLWKTLGVVSSQYVDKPVDQQKLMYGAVQGLVNALGDPHSEFFTPDANKKFQQDLNGNFEGIGAELGMKDGNIVVIAPLPDSPAEKAGIRSQDIIVKINGQDTANMILDEAVNQIRGAKGTTVTLTVLHQGDSDTKDITITRDAITVKSVKSEIKTVNGKKYSVITISRFGTDTDAGFQQAVAEATSSGVHGLIIDLRNDPGGLLDTAIDVASYWLKDNQVVLKELDANKKESSYYSKGPGQLSTIPTVVLINGGSASASEILSGALHDYGLATLVGEKSYGKGSVQDLVDLGGGAAVKITIAKWLTPQGHSIDKQGIDPDVKVTMTNADYIGGKDPQMDKALQMISSK